MLSAMARCSDLGRELSFPVVTGFCDWLLTLKGLLGMLTPAQDTATVCLREEVGV